MTDAERIAELEYEVAWLRAELGRVDDDCALIAEALKVTPQQARLLLFLHNAYPRVLSMYYLNDHLPGVRDREARSSDVVKTMVWQTRRRLGRPAIETAWGAGYRLSAATRVLVARALTTSPLSG